MHTQQEEDAYQDFLKNSGLPKWQIKQLQEFEQTFREINETDSYEEDSWY